jgi:hypothetical protein
MEDSSILNSSFSAFEKTGARHDPHRVSKFSGWGAMISAEAASSLARRRDDGQLVYAGCLQSQEMDVRR